MSYHSPHIRGASRLDSVKRRRCSSQDMFLASASAPMIFRFPRCMIWSKKTLSLLVNPRIKTRYTVGVMTPSSFYPLCWPPLNQPLTRVPVPLLLNSLRLTMHWLPDMRCCNFDPPCHVLQIPLNLPLIWVPVPLLLNLLWLTTHWPPDTKCRGVYSPFQVLLNPPLT